MTPSGRCALLFPDIFSDRSGVLGISPSSCCLPASYGRKLRATVCGRWQCLLLPCITPLVILFLYTHLLKFLPMLIKRLFISSTSKILFTILNFIIFPSTNQTNIMNIRNISFTTTHTFMRIPIKFHVFVSVHSNYLFWSKKSPTIS